MGFLIAFVIAALSGLGVGGGGLFALYLKFFSDYSQISVQALNLIFFLFASGTALTVHLTRRRIYFLPVCIMILFGLLGSTLGSGTALALRTEMLGKIFGAMLVLAGAYSFWRANKKPPS